jgi:hypothetical protein
MTAQARALAQKHFGDLGPEVVDMMYDIAMAESGGDNGAYGTIAPGERSHGIWQINVGEGANTDLAGWNLNDPETNARAARLVYDRQGPTAWSTYTGVIADGARGGQQQAAPSERGVIDALLSSLIENQPQPGDFTDEVQNGTVVYPATEQYQDALSSWMTSLQSAAQLRQSFAEEEAGMFRMEDGQIITREQMDGLDAGSRAQVEAYIANKNIERQNAFNQIVNELDLTEFTTGQNSAGMENQRRSTDFQNQMEGYREQIGLDMANQNTASKKVDRQLSGMQEASSRAATAMDALLKAAPWGTTNGKSSFSPADLGGAVSSMARFGGIGANDPLVNFTGTQTIDPNAMFNFFDQQMGVSGPLPQIPDLMTQPGQIPQAPGSIPIQQGSPSFARPQAPVPTPMPSATNEIMRNIMAMYSNGAWARR